MGHAPLPWRTRPHEGYMPEGWGEPVEIVDANGNTVACNTAFYPTAITPDDAEFIVDAVNSRPTVAAQQDGGLVAELLAIDEAAMYERPATTRATIERAATALAEKDARIAELELLVASKIKSVRDITIEASRAECEGLRSALKRAVEIVRQHVPYIPPDGPTSSEHRAAYEAVGFAFQALERHVRAALSQKETGDAT